MSEHLKRIRIFAASPSDVVSERAKLETVVESLKPMVDYLGLSLEVVDWRTVVPDAGRPQQVIFDQLEPTSWDIFIGVLWHRFGTPPGAKDTADKDYLSGTEEEFKTAYQLWKQHSRPRMVIYRCTRALPFDVDPDQLKKVREFFKLIENVKGDYPALYQAFETIEAFEKLLLDNLQKLLIEYSEQSKTPITPEISQALTLKIPNNLPRRQAFFGRANEMSKVMRAISPTDRTWGVLVDGIGGIGKSAIAIEAAHRLQGADLFEAFVFVTAKQNILEPSGIKKINPTAQTLDDFLNETARVLGQSGIAKLTGKEKRRALIDTLRSMRTLLIYDNLETLSKEEQEGVADFLRELPQGCKAIITSRRRGGEGGVWLRVEKLDWDAAQGIIENQKSLDTALANKLDRVGKTRWQELFDETNGSPLALVHILGLMRVRTTLSFDGALKMLRDNNNEDLQKFIFQEAHKELTENDKTALGALSFFAPSATFEAWMGVSDLSHSALETTIERLNAISLVNTLAGEERYNLHPLTRAFIRNELLADANIVHSIKVRFTQYWVDYANRYGGNEKESYKTYNFLEEEWTNLEITAKWLIEMVHIKNGGIENENAAQTFANFTNSLSQFLQFSGRWDESYQLNSEAYDIVISMKNQSMASNLAGACAKICLSRGLSSDTKIWMKRLADLMDKNPKKTKETQRKNKQSEKQGKSIYDVIKGLRSVRGVSEVDEILIMMYQVAGISEQSDKNYSLAGQNFRDSLRLARKRKDKPTQQEITNSLGNLYLERKHLKRARKWFDESLSLAQEINNISSIAEAKYGLAIVCGMEGNTSSALSLAQETLSIFEKLQHRGLENVREFLEMLNNEKE